MKNKYSKSRRSFIKKIMAGSLILSLSSLTGFAHAKEKQTHMTENNDNKLLLGMVVFDGFQLLDTFGPLEMFGALREKVDILMIGQQHGTVRSSAGPSVL